jgi:Lar family restriction alleviation protein
MNLKPCPFCGSTDVRILGVRGFRFGHCYRCKADGPTTYPRQEAADKWNERATDKAEAFGNNSTERR